ncbi:hypothetical protein SEA_Maroc7_45 [Mycobacterium phage Maroc7]|nr:hypothetical protein SEA_FASCINUS_43 [Mycobacterium phage Fascinus]AXQ64302.1 hypothetical protein SEA_Maroc7_45 [Mycobacterium phage Maroc7]QWS69622.1 hypothetical protein SEA_GYZLAR_43 [Mycobacterium phage Gyzlar]
MTVTTDPWGSNDNGPEQPLTSPSPEPPATWQKKKETPVTNNTVIQGSGDQISLTFKGNGQFSDRWLVAKVATPAEGLVLLEDPKFKELLDLSRRIAAYDANEAAGSAPASAQQPQQRQSGGYQRQAPQGAQEAPEWAPPKPYDDFVYKTGVSKKTGKVWHAWMPPTKDDGRDAKFFYAN